MKEILINLFEKDLNILIKEIDSYSEESDLWKTAPGITNSAGNLALHLVGNLQHFIGAILGDTGYVRNREAEFSDRNVPKAKILQDIQKTIGVVSATLSKLNDQEINDIYPIEVFGKPMTTLHFLVHLEGHLNYHLGQVNYHRRLLASQMG
ncbi:DinB family protein [Marinoscillum luteum]|uniref:DinB family protein n=1 Tax=Marinoscillum luteum TaxID=861051 RepID=A0ABW7N2X8_9BACT